MKLYLDSADLGGIRPLLKTGAFYGVTTNPSILQRDHLPRHGWQDFYNAVVDAGANIVFFQSWGETSHELVSHAQELQGIGDKVVVKIPLTQHGASAASALLKQACPVLLTAIYAPSQATIAAALGATYIAPYLGRMRDAGRDTTHDITQMQAALHNTPTQILLASIRTQDDIATNAALGVQHFTLGLALAQELFQNPSTLEANATFENAMRTLERSNQDQA